MSPTCQAFLANDDDQVMKLVEERSRCKWPPEKSAEQRWPTCIPESFPGAAWKLPPGRPHNLPGSSFPRHLGCSGLPETPGYHSWEACHAVGIASLCPDSSLDCYAWCMLASRSGQKPPWTSTLTRSSTHAVS